MCQAKYGYVPLEEFFKIMFLFSIHTDVVSCKHWLASGSNESAIHVHDLNSMLGTNVFFSSHAKSWKLLSYTCCVSFLSESEQLSTVTTWFKESTRIFWKKNTSVRLHMLSRAKANSLLFSLKQKNPEMI